MVRKARNTRLLRAVIEDSVLLVVYGRISIGHLEYTWRPVDKISERNAMRVRTNYASLTAKTRKIFAAGDRRIE